MRILLDVMGGDHSPSEFVRGGVAASRHQSIDVVFAGDPRVVEDALRDVGEHATGRFDILASSDVIRMDDAPVRAVREKADSSLVLGLRALQAGDVDAFVSPGNTGAVVAASLFTFGRVRGCLAPGFSPSSPRFTGRICS